MVRNLAKLETGDLMKIFDMNSLSGIQSEELAEYNKDDEVREPKSAI